VQAQVVRPPPRAAAAAAGEGGAAAGPRGSNVLSSSGSRGRGSTGELESCNAENAKWNCKREEGEGKG